jgi:superfamily II DNA or RNA helicase
MRSVRLRRWQGHALDRFRERERSDFLAVATPGAGKTTLALVAARQFLAEFPDRRLIVVTPTQHLKSQWADAAEALDLHLETSWSAKDGRPPADTHGLVTTYQQVAVSVEALVPLARDAFVVLDEVHHAGDERAWGDAVAATFGGAHVRLALSGTPFRSDTLAIPFVHYNDDGLAQPDVEYGYGDALADGAVVRPVHFPRLGGDMEWIDADGHYTSASFEDVLDPTRASQRLRTALSTDGEWLPNALERAHEQLKDVRRTHPGAAGLVIATDQTHAREVAEILRRRTGVKPVLVISEDSGASDRIAAFARGTEPWIVAVRMVSEGVDIPRLRVGVFATTTTTELFFRQAVGRLVRWTRGLGRQPSYMFIPDDLRLRMHAHAITEQRRHSLKHDDDAASGDEESGIEFDRVVDDAEGQLSLFAAISAVPGGAGAVHRVDHPAEEPDDDSEDGVLLDLAPITLFSVPAIDGHEDRPGRLREYRRALRDANASMTRRIARITGLSHAQVNVELNRRVGLDRVSEATIEQLERRKDQASGWLMTA